MNYFYLKHIIIGLLFFLAANISAQAQCGTIKISASKYNICEGNAIAVYVSESSQIESYTWVLYKANVGLEAIDTVKGKSFDTASFLVLKEGKYTIQLFTILENGKSCVTNLPKNISVGSAPSTMSITTSAKKVCELPAEVTFTTAADPTLTYDWLISNEGIEDDGAYYQKARNNQKHSFQKPGYKTVVLRVTNQIGCQTTQKIDSIVYVDDIKSIDFEITELTAACDEKVIQTKPTQVLDTTAKVSWSFLGGTPATSSDLFPSTVTYSKEGDYTVSLLVETEGGCKQKVQKNDVVAVGNLVTPDIQLTETEVCANTETFFFDKTKTPNGGTVEWIFPGGNVDPEKSNDKKQVVKYSTPGSFAVYYKYEKGGCASELLLADTIKVRSFSASFAPEYTCNCEPGNVLFTNGSSSSLSTEKLKYFWKITDENKKPIFSSKAKDASFNFSKMGTFDVNLTVTNELGCDQSTNKNIEFKPLEAAFGVNSKLICLGDEVTTIINSGITCDNKLDSITWLFYDATGKKVLSEQQTKIGKYEYTKPGVYNIALLVKNASGCADTILMENAVEVFDLELDFKVSETDVCLGDEIEIELIHRPISVNATNSWRIMDPKTRRRVVSTDSKFKFSFTDAGTYDLFLTSAKSAKCADTLNLKKVFIVSGTKVSFTSKDNENCLPLKDELKAKVQYNINHRNGDNDIDFTWSSNQTDGITFSDASGAATNVEITKNEQYDLRLTAVNGAGCQTVIDSALFYKAGVVAKFDMPQVACTNIPFTLNNHSYINPVKYNWTTTATDVEIQPNANSTSPTVIIGTEGVYDFKLITENKIGCLDSITKSINVIEFDFDFESKDTNGLCSPALISFKAKGVNVDYYLWEFGDGQHLQTTNDSVTHVYDIQDLLLNDNSTFDVSVTAYSKYGCEKTIVKKEYITVWGPQPKFALKNNVGTGKSEVEFIDLSKNVSRFYIDYNDQTSVDSSFGTHTYQMLYSNLEFNVYKPFMVAFDDRNCIAIYPNNKAVDSVIIYNTPIPTFTVDTTEACDSGYFSFTNTSRFADSFAWYIDGVDTAFSHEINPSIGLSNGLYSIRLEAFNNDNYKKAKLERNLLYVHQLPEINFGLEKEFSCINQLITIFDSSKSNHEIVAWQWNINGMVYNTQNIQHLFNDYGNYDITLKVIDAKNCEASTTFNEAINVERPQHIEHGGINFLTIVQTGDVELSLDAKPAGARELLLFTDKSGTINRLYPLGYSTTDSILGGTYLARNTPNTRYALKAIDQCHDTVLIGNWHKPLTIEIYNPRGQSQGGDDINYFPSISFDEYEGWNQVDHYEIWRAINGQKLEKLANIEAENGFVQYVDSLVCQNNYQYQVKAIHPNLRWNSNSPSDTTTPVYLAPEGFVDLVNTTVQNGQVIINWNQHNHPRIEEYVIARKDPNFNEVSIYGRTADTFFVDNDVYVYDDVYQYQVRAVDYCRNTTNFKETANSIVLVPNRNDDHVSLAWNHFNMLHKNATYFLERRSEGNDYQVIFETSTDTHFTDLDIFKNEEDTFTYRIRMEHENGTSFSNRVLFMPDARIFFPNAFTPNNDGLNDEFKIIGSGTRTGDGQGFDNFRLTIIDRWGEQLFSTNNLDEGWDGTFRSQPVPAGTYVYRVQLRNAAGQFFYHADNLTLIK
ncbi:MAG: gliding motility-associated C-terminal domain-containing protein [Bacteroidetes bacterium]|nr:gliding motility-associated C-terminal domain-containing protein [Bacteroidota bacterium]